MALAEHPQWERHSERQVMSESVSPAIFHIAAIPRYQAEPVERPFWPMNRRIASADFQ
jgi:hypothetical protein